MERENLYGGPRAPQGLWKTGESGASENQQTENLKQG